VVGALGDDAHLFGLTFLGVWGGFGGSVGVDRLLGRFRWGWLRCGGRRLRGR
jgi:hypothetical protein